MRRKILNHQESVMLLFTCKPLYEQYQRAISRFVSIMSKDKTRFVELTFEDPKGLFLDNKVEEPTFMEIEDVIINLWSFKVEKFLKYIKWNRKVIFYVEKKHDSTTYHIIGQESSVAEFKKVYNFKSWSVKRNLTKKERSFVFKFVNGLFKNKYSWTYLYFENLVGDIKNLKTQEAQLESEIAEISLLLGDSLALGVDVSEIREEYLELLDELNDIESKLEYKKAFEDKLLYSVSDEPTTIEDYAFFNSEE